MAKKTANPTAKVVNRGKGSSTLGAGPNNSWNGCPETGKTSSPEKKAENRLKNRNDAPTTFEAGITLKAMLAPGKDRTRFRPSQAARVTGYIVRAERGGPESCNCKSTNWRDYDIHIELVADKVDAANPRKHVIAEVTPRWRSRLGDLGNLTKLQQLQGGKVKLQVSGWMFFDPDHMSESENTNPGGPKNWRATGWEIHPVTQINVLG